MNTPADQSLSITGRKCAKMLAFIVPLLIAALALLGKAIEHRAQIGHAVNVAWGGLIWSLTLGESFWGAAIITFAIQIVLAWAICVACKLPEKSAHMAKITGTIVAASFGWIFMYFAFQTTFVSFESLTFYGQIAVVTLSLPWVVPALVIFFAIIVS